MLALAGRLSRLWIMVCVRGHACSGAGLSVAAVRMACYC